MSGSIVLIAVVGLLGTIAAAWIALAIAVVVARPQRGATRAMLRVLPNVVRLMWGLLRDPTTPFAVRCRIVVALAYNAQPINVIPDFVPVVGFVDNLVVTTWALRSAARHAGPDRIASHWPGTDDELALVYRLARLGVPTAT